VINRTANLHNPTCQYYKYSHSTREEDHVHVHVLSSMPGTPKKTPAEMSRESVAKKEEMANLQHLFTTMRKSASLSIKATFPP
jgi:hypothetical protein